MNFTIAVMTQMKCINRRNDPNEMHNLIDDLHFADVRSKMHDALLDYMDKIRDPFRSYQWNLRPWRKDAHPRWMGAFRPRPQDGYSPVVRDYDTGLPTQGVTVDETKQKFGCSIAVPGLIFRRGTVYKEQQ